MKNSVMPKRRGSFLEIGGNLGVKLQVAYEEAARRASEANAAVSITAKITVRPPDRNGIGSVEYSLGTTLPAYKSIKYETEFGRDGTIVATAPMDIGVMQESLYFDDDDAEVEAVKEELITI